MKEMLQGKVSVIVPAYNAARLLERCVRSITGQTYPALEVIVVDDGSKDDTGKIADQLAAEDSRIRVVHKTNGGVSAARNDALKLVEGEWITFVDSDDYLEPDFLRSLLDGEVADLVIGGYHTVGANEIPSANYPTDTAHSPEAIKRALEARLTDMTFLCPWGAVPHFSGTVVKADFQYGDEGGRRCGIRVELFGSLFFIGFQTGTGIRLLY